MSEVSELVTSITALTEQVKGLIETQKGTMRIVIVVLCLIALGKTAGEFVDKGVNKLVTNVIAEGQ